MKTREIIISMAAFAGIGGFFIVYNIVTIWRNGFSDVWGIAWSALCVVFAATILARCLPPAVKELCGRRKSARHQTEL